MSPPSRLKIAGAVIGLVTNNKDPDNWGRVKVQFPWLADEKVESTWARLAHFYAGPDRGGYIIPEVGDEVVLMFEHGDMNAPYVVGSLWNGKDKVPGPGNPDGENNTKWWQSRSGHKMRFEDKDGAEKIILVDKSGKLTFHIDVAADLITMEATTGDIYFKAPEGPINIEAKTMTINASNSSKITVGNGLNEISKNRSETIGVNDTGTASVALQIGTKSLTMSFGTSSIEMGAGTMTVAGASTQTTGESKVKADTIHRTSGPETLTAGALDIKGKHFELLTTGAATITAGSLQLKAKTDQAVISSSILTVMGGLINYNGGSSLSNMASLVTLC